MAKSDIFNINPKTNRGPRNAFDISYCNLFTSPCGMILPAYVEDVKEGDKLRLDVSCVTRTRPVNTSAFMTFDEKIDFWFVPYRLLWSAYPQWRLSQSFPRSTTSMVRAQNQNLLPTTSWLSLSKFMESSKYHKCSLEYNFATPSVADAFRLIDLLGYGAPPSRYYSLVSRTGDWSDESSDVIDQYGGLCGALDYSGVPLNYFRLAAFQCIYMSSYRNEEFELLDPSYYNMDSLFIQQMLNSPYPDNTVPGDPSSLVSSVANYLVVDSGATVNWAKLLTPRYKNWRKDLFTALKPSSGLHDFGSSNVPSVGSGSGATGSSFDWPISSLDGTPSGASTDDPTYNGFSGPLVNPFQKLISHDGSFVLYAQNIRNLMAQDKFSRLMIYADKDYSSQMKALFGVEVDEPDVPRYLGSFSNDVSISDVVATSAGTDGDSSDPSSSVLGQIAGKGYGTRNGHCFESDFKEDGVVIGMHYITPRNNYDSYRVNKFNTKVSRWDYYFPMFDGLGLQPTFNFERGYYSYPSGIVGSMSNLLGYSPRYYEYKTRQNETHGCFMTEQSDYDWTLSNNQFNIISGDQMVNYKIHPKITDRIFTVEYNGSQASDPFLCFMQFSVTRVSNLETFGIPSF